MDKKEEILEIASNIFREFGFQKANLTHIAGQCGMNKAGLYYYFKNKEDLFRSMLLRDINNLQHRLSKSLSTSDEPVKRLRKFIILRTQSFGLMKKYLEMFTEGVTPPSLRRFAKDRKYLMVRKETDMLSGFLRKEYRQLGWNQKQYYHLAVIILGISDKIGAMSVEERLNINIEASIDETLRILFGLAFKED